MMATLRPVNAVPCVRESSARRAALGLGVHASHRRHSRSERCTFWRVVAVRRPSSGERRCSQAPSLRDSAPYPAGSRLCVTLEVETLMLTASAESRLAAISKDVRVRVDGSKKRLITVRPRSAGTFLISRRETSRNVSAVSSRCVISPASSSRIPRRCLRLKDVNLVGLTSRPACQGFYLETYKKAAIAGRCYSSRFGRRSLDDNNAFFLVKLFEHHFDNLALFGRH